jgi:hypothetical protein
MPEEGVPLTPDEDVLSIDEIVSLAKVFVVSAIRAPPHFTSCTLCHPSTLSRLHSVARVLRFDTTQEMSQL